MLCEAEKAFPDEYVKLFHKRFLLILKREKKVLGVMAEIIHPTFFCHIVSYLVAYYGVKPCYLY